MLPDLHVVLAGIRNHVLVQPSYYAGLPCDEMLAQRDARGLFDTDWADLYARTKARWNDLSPEIRGQVDTIRKEAFLVVSHATSHHEIASYVSDDFDLLGRCRILEIEHPLLDYLWRAYQSGTFPVPTGYAAP